MEPLTPLIPPQHRDAVLLAVAVLYALDAIIRAIPDRILAAHTTVEAITNAVKALAAWARRNGPPPSGAAAVAALLVLLLALPARAGGPESTPRAPMPADIAAAPAVPVVPSSLIEAARVQAIVAAALENAQRGVATLAPSWMDSKAGQVLVGCIAGAIVITSAAGAGIGAGLTFGK